MITRRNLAIFVLIFFAAKAHVLASDEFFEGELAAQVGDYVQKYKEDIKLYSESNGFLPFEFDVFIYQLEDRREALAAIEEYDLEGGSKRVSEALEEHLVLIQFFEKRVALIAIAASSVRPANKNAIANDYMKVASMLNKYEMRLLEYAQL